MNKWKAKKLIEALENNNYIYNVEERYNAYQGVIYNHTYNLLKECLNEYENYSINVEIDGNLFIVYFDDFQTPQQIFNNIFTEINKK